VEKKKIKVIGCGNLLAYDEGVGIHVVRKLKNNVLPENVEIKELRNPGQLLLELVSEADKLIIIDACPEQSGVGTVHRFTRAEGEIREILSNTIHAYHFYPVFELREQSNQRKLPEEIVVLGIEIEKRNRFCVGLSQDVFAALERAIEIVMEELQ